MQYKKEVNLIYNKLNLQQKVELLSGKNSVATKDFTDIGLPPVYMCDGPLGVRFINENMEKNGIDNPMESTCFPSPALVACSFDTSSAYEIGCMIAEEAIEKDISMIMAPAVNIKRIPNGGRNFEYYSEDSFLTSEMATAFINGIQSKGVGACIKHFAVNNQETNRLAYDAIVSLKTLHEIYLKAFKKPIQKAKPWAVMCAYNSLNGEFCSQNFYLLNNVLRKLYKFDGITISDWGACLNRIKGLNSGLNLEMPSSNGYFDKQIIEAFNSNAEEKIDSVAFENAVKHILDLILKAKHNKDNHSKTKYNIINHHEKSVVIARESMVLLKNDCNLLPLTSTDKLAIIGYFAKESRFQGGGCAHTNSINISIPLSEIIKNTKKKQLQFAKGYNLDGTIDKKLQEYALKISSNADKIIIFVGLPESEETEGLDRKTLSLPLNQLELIRKISKINSNICIVVSCGGVLELPFKDSVKSILYAYLGGEASGTAIADILFGNVNPCGKLAETIPLHFENNPAYENCVKDLENKIFYSENCLVGHHYYTVKKVPVAYNFGFGLSYSSFIFFDLKINKKTITINENITLSFFISNVSDIDGKEVAQIYAKNTNSTAQNSFCKLIAFKKVFVKANSTQKVNIKISCSEFEEYDETLKQMLVPNSIFNIYVSKSCENHILQTTLRVENPIKKRVILSKDSFLRDLLFSDIGTAILKSIIDRLVRLHKVPIVCLNKEDLPLQNILDTKICKMQQFYGNAIANSTLEDIVNAINNKDEIICNKIILDLKK